jgi:UDP-glucuronate 4-epimerase
MKLLITGGAGFIGSHLVDRVLKEGHEVTVIDNFDPSYSPAAKEENIAEHNKHPRYTLLRADIRNMEILREKLSGDFDQIIHLAACAGVRPSIANPVKYHEVNIGGTQNLLELAKERGIKRFVFASSSSVYGINPNVPWKEDEPHLRPISPYASTKASCEILGSVYSHLYGIRFTALRFFTVYGPRQRPDLAIHKFASGLIRGVPIPIHGDGSSSRDYTYIDDIVAGLLAALDHGGSDYEIINLGNDRSITLMDLVQVIAKATDTDPIIQRLGDQPGDVPHTRADITKASRLLNYRPTTTVESGVEKFTEWLRRHDSVPA